MPLTTYPNHRRIDTEFRLVEAVTVDILNDEVNRLLDEGWDLHGNTEIKVLYAGGVADKTYFYQPLVKYQLIEINTIGVDNVKTNKEETGSGKNDKDPV